VIGIWTILMQTVNIDYRDAPIVSTRSIQTPYGEQDENGADLSLIRENLRLSPAERLRRGDDATTSALILRTHARRVKPNPSSISSRIVQPAQR